MDVLKIVLTFFVGLLTGFLNVMAGGSSFGARYMVLNETVLVKYLLFVAILFAALKMFFS